MNHPVKSVPARRTTGRPATGRPQRTSRPDRETTATPTDGPASRRPAAVGFLDDTEPQPRTGSTATESRPSAVDLARRRRSRRNARIATTLHGGAPVGERRVTARQVPFVAVLVALLGAGLAGVLWLNTLTDEAGIRTNQARTQSASLQLKIEALESDIALKSAPPALAEAARAIGLVPGGDAAILIVPADGSAPTVVGEPKAVPDPVAEAAAAQAAAQAAADAAAQQAAAQAAADAAAQQAAAQAAADAAAQQAAADAAAQQAAADAAAQQAAADAAAASTPVDAPAADAITPTTPADAVVTSSGAAG